MPRCRSPISLLLFILLPTATLIYLWRSSHHLTPSGKFQFKTEPTSDQLQDLGTILHPSSEYPTPVSTPTPPPSSPSTLNSPTRPKITIISIWNTGKKPAIYLPNYFASVKGNPLIDLLFVVVDKYEVGRCHVETPDGAPNIKQVCFSVEEYWNLHADFLCKHWECQGDDRAVIIDKLHERYGGDHVCIHSPTLSRYNVLKLIFKS